MNARLSARQALSSLAGDRQTNRLLRLSFPHGHGPAAILLVNHLSAHEAISRDFQFTVEVLQRSHQTGGVLDEPALSGPVPSV